MGKLLCCILLVFLNSQLCFSSSNSSSSPPQVAKICHPNDSSALLQLKNALLFINSTFNPCYLNSTDTWKEGTDCCLFWFGVGCHESTGHVTYLDLSSSCLQGTIHSNSSLFLLYHLQSLNLANNNFSFSSIPSKFGKLKQLQSLHLSFNCFACEIPDAFGNLSKLNELYLAGNNLSGQIPPSIFSLKKLQVLDLGLNQLEGQLRYKISGLSTVNRLDFSHNMLSDKIPPSIFSLKKLQVLDLGLNQLEGQLPYKISGLYTLYHLDLSHNMLSGRIPSWLFKIPSLEFLDLSYNSLTGPIDQFQQHPQNNIQNIDLRWNLLQGPLIMPPASTEYFIISNNQLSGEIPSSLCSLTVLKILDLFHNNLKGVVPQCMGNFSSSLQVIDLRNITFRGNIPETFETCLNLGILNINHNNFQGKLPPSLVNCASLEILDLGSNNIVDTFPHWLEPLSYLRVNGFSGTIGHPEVEHPFPKLQSLMSRTKFTGPLPAIYLKILTYMMEANVNDNPGHMGATDSTEV